MRILKKSSASNIYRQYGAVRSERRSGRFPGRPTAQARRSIEQAQENLRITRLKYEEGLQQESDPLDAITNLSRAQANEVAMVRTVFLNYFQIIRMVDGF